MAHKIDTTNGESCMTVKTPAWHGLGVTVAEAQTSDEAIRLAKLDWEVEQWPLSASNGEHGDAARKVAITNKVANVRSDTNASLGVVGDGYQVFQNREAFDFMDAIVGDKLAMYHTAGGLKGGRTVWMLAKVPGELRIGDDVTENYVLLCNSHDGTGALRMIPTSVRVVCANTLRLAMLGKRDDLVIHHTASLQDRVAEARENLGIIAQRFGVHGEQVQAMAARRISTGGMHHYCKMILPDVEGKNNTQRERTRELWFKNFTEGECQQVRGTEGSVWSAYNAVSEWADHQRNFGVGRYGKADTRLNSAWFGDSARRKKEAYDAALSLI